MELDQCPRCGQELKPGKHHVGCSGTNGPKPKATAGPAAGVNPTKRQRAAAEAATVARPREEEAATSSGEQTRFRVGRPSSDTVAPFHLGAPGVVDSLPAPAYQQPRIRITGMGIGMHKASPTSHSRSR